jgi:hypothetical protein
MSPGCLCRRAAAALASACCGALIAGCAAPPTTRLHSLLPAQPLPAGAAAAPPLAVALTSVTLPLAVDQSPWLVRLPDGSLVKLEQDRWVSPLGDELRAALRELLAQRWGAVQTAGQPADWRITLEVTRFESIAGQEARLEARWTLAAATGGGAAGPGCHVVLREPVAAGTAALAAGHQHAVARLADRIGEQLRAVARGEPQRCIDAGG